MEKKKRSGRSVGLGLLVLVVLLFLGAAAQAELITIAIEATVNVVEDDGNYLEGKVNVGDIITGYYTYESTTPDSNPDDPIQGNYWHYSQPAGVFLSVGGFDFETDISDGKFQMFIRDNTTPQNDTYGFFSFNNNPLSNGTLVDNIYWGINDSNGDVLFDDSLPTTAPILSQWDYDNYLSIETDRMYRINALVTSAVLIPEPITLFLFGLGGLFLKKSR